MPRLVFETLLPCPISRVWEFHASAEALKALTPPWRQVEVLSDDLRVVEGAIHRIRVKMGPMRLEWHARIVACDPPRGFSDVADRSPFARWLHHHRFVSMGPATTKLRDEIEYEAPFGFLGRIADAVFIRRDLERLFAFRHAETARLLAD